MAGAGERLVIVGGGIVGSSIAWFLREQGYEGDITVIERDPTYEFASTALSAAAIRTQFGTAINIHMSLYGAAFLRNLTRYFGPSADVGFKEKGYLILGGEDAVDQRRAGARMQCAEGADIVGLDTGELAAQFPFLNVEDVGIGTFGQSHEGWFDAWSLLAFMRVGARDRNVTYLKAEVAGLKTSGDSVTGVALTSGDGLDCSWCVNAAGAWSAKVVRGLGIDLPVVPRKRSVFSFKTPLEAANFPMLFDTSGIWVRPEGEGFIGGIQPPEEEDTDPAGNFEPHHNLQEEVFWPFLAHRIPTMEELRFERAWAGLYEVNTLDHNGIVGPHHELGNLIFATGFSGHGVMHAPAAGRAVAEWIINDSYQTLDLTPLGWDRIHEDRPLVETVVI